MPQNGRLAELLTQMLGEQRITNTRLEGLEKEQATTNLLLKQHGLDLMKIADLLDQGVVHWGDRVRIDGEKGITGVVSKL